MISSLISSSGTTGTRLRTTPDDHQQQGRRDVEPVGRRRDGQHHQHDGGDDERELHVPILPVPRRSQDRAVRRRRPAVRRARCSATPRSAWCSTRSSRVTRSIRCSGAGTATSTRLASDALGPAVRLEQQPERGDVDQHEVLDVDEDLTGAGVDHAVQALPDVGRRARVEAPAQHEDPPPLRLLDVHPLPLLRCRTDRSPGGRTGRCGERRDAARVGPAGAPVAGGRILGPTPATGCEGPACEGR